jgi:hypothetical protein
MSGPSDAYRQHHDVAAPRIDAVCFRPGWRIETRLDALWVEGAIDAATWQAGLNFRNDWEAGIGLRGGALPVRVQSSPDGGMGARLGALARLRRIADALGAFQCRVLDLSVVRDLPWREAGRALGVHRETAKRYAVTALRALAALGAPDAR